MAAHLPRVFWVRVIGLFNTWAGVLGTGLQQPLAESLRPQQKLVNTGKAVSLEMDP